MIPFPPPLPAVSLDRIINYLAGGKDHFREDVAVAHRMLDVDPYLLDRVADIGAFATQAVTAFAAQGIAQMLVLKCGLPELTRPQLHDRLAAAVDGPARAIYLDDDLQALVHARAYWQAISGVTVLDANLTHPGRFLADPRLAAGLDPHEPVGVLACHALEHLDDGQLEALCSGLADYLPAGSRMALAHPTGPDAGRSAEVCTHALADHGGRGRPCARSPDLVEHLLVGWQLTEPLTLCRAARAASAGLVTGWAALK
ncbi:SAM-dependent methyltransferase [Nocardiopsis sp. NPDC055824]